MGPGGTGNNREQLKEHEIFVFDIFDIDMQRYLSPYERVRLVKELELNIHHS